MSDAPIAYYNENGVAVFRASAAGFCEAALVHSLRGMEPAAPPESMLRRFNDGHLHEPAILDHLRTLGYEIAGGQNEIRVSVTDELMIVGHVDGTAKSATGEHYVVEAKALSDAGYKKWVAQGFAAYENYAIQISIYMAALQLPALYAVKNKNSGEVHVQVVDKPPYLLAKTKAKLIRVARTATTNRTPDCPKHFDYPCAFFALHPDRGQTDVPVEPGDLGDELNELCSRYLSAKSQVKFWEDAADEIRGRLLEEVAATGSTSLYKIVRTEVAAGKKLNTRRLRAAFPDLSQFEEIRAGYTKLEVEARSDV